MLSRADSCYWLVLKLIYIVCTCMGGLALPLAHFGGAKAPLVPPSPVLPAYGIVFTMVHDWSFGERMNWFLVQS